MSEVLLHLPLKRQRAKWEWRMRSDSAFKPILNPIRNTELTKDKTRVLRTCTGVPHS